MLSARHRPDDRRRVRSRGWAGQGPHGAAARVLGRRRRCGPAHGAPLVAQRRHSRSAARRDSPARRRSRRSPRRSTPPRSTTPWSAVLTRSPTVPPSTACVGAGYRRCTCTRWDRTSTGSSTSHAARAAPGVRALMFLDSAGVPLADPGGLRLLSDGRSAALRQPRGGDPVVVPSALRLAAGVLVAPGPSRRLGPMARGVTRRLRCRARGTHDADAPSRRVHREDRGLGRSRRSRRR